jgi:hypothetical protein
MKKLLTLALFAGALAFTACNEKKAENAEGTTDSTAMMEGQTEAMESEAGAAMDTAKAAMDTAKAAMDTAKKAGEGKM